MTEVDVGLAGGVSHVRRFFREFDARLLIYTARRMSGPELYRMGVVSACVTADALLATAQGIAREIAGKSPLCGPGGKTILQRHGEHAVARRLSVRTVPNGGACFQGRYQGSARAFAEKRKPVFRGG